MHNRTKNILASVSVAALIVVGTDAMTYAGTGDSLILGHANKSNKTTHIKSTGNGPALSLHAKGKRPALAVDSKAKIVRLNADTVDGHHAADLRTRARVYTKSSGSFDAGSADFKVPQLPKGTYQVSYSLYMDGTAGSPSQPITGFCWIDNGGHRSGLTSSDSTYGYVGVGLSGSAVITTDDQQVVLECYAVQTAGTGESWSIDSEFPVRVSFLRIDKKTSGHLTS